MSKTSNPQDTVRSPGLFGASRRVKTWAGLGLAAVVAATTIALGVPAATAASPGTASQSPVTGPVSPVPPASPAPVKQPTPPPAGQQTGCCA